MHGDIEKGISGVFPDVKTIVVSVSREDDPPEYKCLIEGMISLGAGDLLLEGDDEKLLAVKQEYGDAMAFISFRDGIDPADLSRLVHILFARRGPRKCDKTYLPAARVEAIIEIWKGGISLIFGDSFASKLADRSLKGKDRDRLTAGDLDDARIFITSALGDCLLLDKVNK
jgi:hypothetical protein